MAWYLLLLPLVSAFLNLTLLRRQTSLAMGVSVLAMLGVLVVSVLAQFGQVSSPAPLVWMDLPEFKVTIGVLIDKLSTAMLLVVSIVGLLVHFFSLGYMQDDAGRGRFFGKLSLFIFSMIGIVVADNLVQMFIFWELVGVSSYLLIGFWFEKPSAADAAKKAFLVNRVGDFGFMLGILGFWTATGTVMILPELKPLLTSSPVVTWIALGLFMGCVGKSAQLPLHVWLPDAMEGPTPVSALIHAATMVAAGVYMLCRVFFVFEAAPDALTVISWVGGLTAVFAALIATQQNDIKRILAYSTLSQLGYMVMAVGCGGPDAAMFHLSTHAMFKALLFLGAGSVIHALHHEQDIWKMGGLWKKVPVTSATFTIGYVALIGVPFFSGFFSKEKILGVAYATEPKLFWVAAFTAVLTAFYMTRLYIVAFCGSAKSRSVDHAHESPLVMTVPLVILAILSVVAGYVGLDSYFAEALHQHPETESGHFVMVVSLVAVTLGVGLGYLLYSGKREETVTNPLLKLLADKFRIDEFYDGVLVWFQQRVAQFIAWVDTWILGVGLVRGAAAGTALGGQLLRLFQAGNLQLYAFTFGLGVALIVLFRLVW